jgi:hypothetical protein
MSAISQSLESVQIFSSMLYARLLDQLAALDRSRCDLLSLLKTPSHVLVRVLPGVCAPTCWTSSSLPRSSHVGGHTSLYFCLLAIWLGLPLITTGQTVYLASQSPAAQF